MHIRFNDCVEKISYDLKHISNLCRANEASLVVDGESFYLTFVGGYVMQLAYHDQEVIESGRVVVPLTKFIATIGENRLQGLRMSGSRLLVLCDDKETPVEILPEKSAHVFISPPTKFEVDASEAKELVRLLRQADVSDWCNIQQFSRIVYDTSEDGYCVYCITPNMFASIGYDFIPNTTISLPIDFVKAAYEKIGIPSIYSDDMSVSSAHLSLKVSAVKKVVDRKIFSCNFESKIDTKEILGKLKLIKQFCEHGMVEISASENLLHIGDATIETAIKPTTLTGKYSLAMLNNALKFVGGKEIDFYIDETRICFRNDERFVTISSYI